MSHRPDTPTVPRGQTRSQLLREQRVYTDLLEMIRHLQQSLKEHFTQLTTWQMQGLLSLEQRHSGAICKQEDILDDLMCQMVNLLGSEAVSGLGPRPPHPGLDSQAGNRGVQRVPSQQADQPVHQQRDSEATLVSRDLSSRGIEISVSYHLDFQDYEAYQRDKYHKVKNTLGFINLGTTENKLCAYLLTERLCRSDMNRIEDILLQYPDWRGQPFLRKEVACFLTDYCQAPSPLDPENVVILNGCYSIFSALAMVLCDPGDAFLVPTPFFGGFVFSSNLYARVELIPVPLESEVSEENTHPFQPTVNKLEQALAEARLERKKVKGLMLINPQNCLGDVCSRDSLQEYLKFAKRNRLHVIVDESYMFSVFDESVTFHSVLSLTSLPDPNRTHMIWGTSKDFGISGLRFGALYTHNKGVASAVCSFGCLHGTSSITQYKLYRLLQDREWIDKVYLPANCSRLRDAYKYVTDELEALEVPFLKGGSGLSVWISLKSYLEPCTFDGELALHRRFLDNKLVLSRGKSFRCEEPGWFRLNFAEKPSELQVAMHRFRQVLEEQKQDWIVKQLADAMRE